MTYPDPGVFPASYDPSSTSVGRDVDQNLWDMMLAENLIFNMIPKGTTSQPKFEWEYSQTNPKYVTIGASSTIDGSGTNKVLVLSAADFALIQKGTLLKNKTVSTLIGSSEAQCDEILQVSLDHAHTAGDVEVNRDYMNLASGTGSTAHAEGNQLEILYTPLPEGSLASDQPNLYKVVGEANNSVARVGFKLQVTGDQFARGMLLAKDNLQTQFDNRMIELRNMLASMILYGTAKTGSDSVVADTKGLASFVLASGANVDYTSTTLTPTVLDNLFKKIRDDGGTQSENYSIICNPGKAQVISHFGEDRVRYEGGMGSYGHQITQFVSDLGFRGTVVDEPMCSPGQLFIVNTRKWQLLTFRPFISWEWGAYTSNPNGDDIWNRRILGAFGVKVVDPLTAHAAACKLTW